MLSHLPMYTLLLPHFLELSLARSTYRPEAAVRDVAAVLGVLAASPALVQELRAVEAAYNRCRGLGCLPACRPGLLPDCMPWCCLGSLLTEQHTTEIVY